MDQETKDTLKEIEGHLKALVNLKALQMTKKMADQGAFEQNGEVSMDKANIRRDKFIESAYTYTPTHITTGDKKKEE